MSGRCKGRPRTDADDADERGTRTGKADVAIEC
jgi:hypothetical protein